MRWSLLKHLFILEAQPEAADLTLKAAELHKETDCSLGERYHPPVPPKLD